MCRSLSRPSHSRPFNMHCPPRAQLLAVAYLGIIRMNSFFLRKGGRTGRREGKKRRSSILNLLLNKKSFLFLLPIILRSRYTLVSSMPSALKSTPLGLGKACERGRLEKKFDLRKIKLVILSKLRQKTGKLKHSQWYTVFTRKSTVQNKISAYVS